jgi:hypothetical protein
MATDVKLDEGPDGSWVLIESGVLKATATDLMLDSPSRRQRGGRLRRALVHDQADGLTVNFNNDYPGGVTINDVRKMTNTIKGLSIQGVSEISGLSTSLQRAARGGSGGKKALLIRGDVLIELPASLLLRSGARARAGRAPRSRPLSLQGVLEAMHEHIERLTARVAQLERRSKPSGGPDRKARRVRG